VGASVPSVARFNSERSMVKSLGINNEFSSTAARTGTYDDKVERCNSSMTRRLLNSTRCLDVLPVGLSLHRLVVGRTGSKPLEGVVAPTTASWNPAERSLSDSRNADPSLQGRFFQRLESPPVFERQSRFISICPHIFMGSPTKR
jgi:hypothetical protein